MKRSLQSQKQFRQLQELAKQLLQALYTCFSASLSFGWQLISSDRRQPNKKGIQLQRLEKFLLTAFVTFLFTLSSSGIIPWLTAPAVAAPSLTLFPLGWNVIGLDSNKVTDGPDQFLEGVRVCNTGDTAATNVTATFVKDGGSSFINILGASTLSIPSLPSGTIARAPGNTGAVPNNCFDFYFNLKVTRNSSAYSSLSTSSTRQQFHIDVSATGLSTLRTPTNRELYVEKLVSQSRNAVDSISGPSTVYVGQTAQYVVNGHTAPGGYEQLVFSPVLPVMFQVLAVSSTYSAPGGATNNSIYGDACGWENDYTSTYYHNNLTCNNPAIPDGYTGAKVGDNVTTTYTIKVLSTGSGTLTNIIYDFSGSSYHYNADLGTAANSYAITALPPNADLSITKTDNQTTAIPGSSISYTLTATNSGPSDITGATIADTVPGSITGVSWACVASAGSSCGAASGTGNTINTTANLLNGGTATYTVTGTVSSTASGNLANTASIAIPSSATDPNTANNSSTDTDTLTPRADLSLTKTHTGNFVAGQNGTYTLTVANSGPSVAGALTVTDTLPAGLSFVSGTGTGWSCSATGQTVTCTNATGLAVGASSTITLTVGVSILAATSVTNTATVSSSATDPSTANNTANDPTTISRLPDLTIAKTHTGNFARSSTGSYTLTVANAGAAGTTGVNTVSDTLPTGLSFSAASGTGWSCSSVGQTVTCTRLDVLAASSSFPPITLTVTVAANAPNSVTNTATVSGGIESNTGNNSANDVTTIVSSTDLAITKTDNQTTTVTGSPISYTIVVTNNGPSTVSSVTVADTIPSTIQNPTFTPSTGSYNSSTGAWTGLTLATGQSVTLTMAGTVSSSTAGIITNTATVAPPSGVTDPTSTNNTATDTTNVNVYAVAPTAGKIVINEVLYRQTTSMTDEFIELYNASTTSVSLNSWKLADGNLIDGTVDGSSGNLSYTFPADKMLAPGEYAVIWLGDNIATNQVSGAAFQVWLGLASTRLNDAGDDIWLYDDQLRIVDYVAYGSSGSINTPPPASLNLWNATYQNLLSGASPGQSISLTANGIDGNTSACWEPTTSGQANGRCTGYLPTRDTDTTGSRITSGGQNNNGVVVTPPSLLLVKRITALNGVNITTIVDDSTSTNDNAANWPTPIDSASGISSYLRGAINGGTVRPSDIVEYTIYFLSNGGSPATNVNLCDLVPANSTFIPTSFSSSPQSGIALAIGTTTTNLTNTSDADNGAYFASGTSPSTTCAAANTNGAVVVSVVKSPSTLPNATAPGTLNSYGFIRFRARVN